MKDRYTGSAVTLRGSKEGQVPRYLEGQTGVLGSDVAVVLTALRSRWLRWPLQEVQYELPEC